MPDETVDALNERLDEMVSKSQQSTQEWVDLWQSGINYCFGNQLSGMKKKDGWDRIQVNYIYPALMQQMAMLSGRNPEIQTLPYEAGDQESANFWKGVLQWQFENELRMPLVSMLSVLDAGVYGFYVGKVFWEPKASWDGRGRRWLGAPRLNLMLPSYFGSDPDAESIDDASYVFSSRRMLLDKAVKRWPEMAAQIEKAALDEQGEGPTAGKPGYTFDALAIEPVDPTDEELGSGAPSIEGRLSQLLWKVRGGPDTSSWKRDENDRPRYVTVEEVYFRDDEERPMKEMGPVPAEGLVSSGQAVLDPTDGATLLSSTTGQPLTPEGWPQQVVNQWDEPTYPFGRKVLRIGRTILNPEPAQQVYEYRQWPFIVGVNQVLPHVWQGMNAVEMAKGLQDWVNVSAAHMANYVKFFGDPQVLVEENALLGNPKNTSLAQKIKARAGHIVQLAKGGIDKIRREPPSPMSSGVMEIYERFARELQDQTGMQEIARGRQAKGQATATEIEELSRTSKVRTAMAAQLQESWMCKVMGLVAELDQKNMQPGDMVRIAGEGTMGGAMQVAQGMSEARFDVKLKIATALPFDQERQKQDWTTLFQSVGPAVLPELLDAYGVKNKQEILQRHGLWQQFQQFVQAQQAMQGQTPPGRGSQAGGI